MDRVSNDVGGAPLSVAAPSVQTGRLPADTGDTVFSRGCVRSGRANAVWRFAGCPGGARADQPAGGQGLSRSPSRSGRGDRRQRPDGHLVELAGGGQSGAPLWTGILLPTGQRFRIPPTRRDPVCHGQRGKRLQERRLAGQSRHSRRSGPGVHRSDVRRRCDRSRIARSEFPDCARGTSWSPWAAGFRSGWGFISSAPWTMLRRSTALAPRLHSAAATRCTFRAIADRLALGWLLRCLWRPKSYVPRYWAARKLAWLLYRYRTELPPMQQVPQTTPPSRLPRSPRQP